VGGDFEDEISRFGFGEEDQWIWVRSVGKTSENDKSRVLRARACEQMREPLMVECWTGVVTAGGRIFGVRKCQAGTV